VYSTFTCACFRRPYGEIIFSCLLKCTVSQMFFCGVILVLKNLVDPHIKEVYLLTFSVYVSFFYNLKFRALMKTWG
jgi:hypothetical protein